MVSPQKLWPVVLHSFLAGMSDELNLPDPLPKNRNGILTGSGKSGLYLIMDFLVRSGVIHPKEHEILVPRKLGYWVYNTLNIRSLISPAISRQTRCIFVYHQYGFPQNMDFILDFAKNRNLVVIEDCAHSLMSYFKGMRCGEIGDYALFSLTKFLPLPPLGAVYGSTEFLEYAQNKIDSSKRWLLMFKDIGKALYESSSSHMSNISRQSLLEMTYAVYHLAPGVGPAGHYALQRADLSGEIEKRVNFYKKVYDTANAFGLCDHLEYEGVTPYLIPLAGEQKILEILARELEARNVKAEYYQFDMVRNMLEPDFQTCLCIPCNTDIIREKGPLILECIDKLKKAA